MEDELTDIPAEVEEKIEETPVEEVIEEAPVEEVFPGEDITPEDSVVPVYLVPLTSEEEAEREQWALEQAAREQAEADKQKARESALAKLAKLGLTEEELATLAF